MSPKRTLLVKKNTKVFLMNGIKFWVESGYLMSKLAKGGWDMTFKSGLVVSKEPRDKGTEWQRCTKRHQILLLFDIGCHYNHNFQIWPILGRSWTHHQVISYLTLSAMGGVWYYVMFPAPSELVLVLVRILLSRNKCQFNLNLLWS